MRLCMAHLSTAVFPVSANFSCHMARVVNTLLLGHTGALLLWNIVALNSGDVFALFNLNSVPSVLVVLVRFADLISECLTLGGVVGPALLLLYGAALNVADNIVDCLTVLRTVLLYFFTLFFILCGAHLITGCVTFQLLQSLINCLTFCRIFLLSPMKKVSAHKLF